MALEHVAGKKYAHIVVYALSTCPWCRKAKQLLGDLGADYFFQDVDLLGEEEQRDVMAEVSRWNEGRSFPTIVIDNSRAIIGFDEQEIRNLVSRK
jgi:glutaredoxin-like protein NrdH